MGALPCSLHDRPSLRASQDNLRVFAKLCLHFGQIRAFCQDGDEFMQNLCEAVFVQRCSIFRTLWFITASTDKSFVQADYRHWQRQANALCGRWRDPQSEMNRKLSAPPPLPCILATLWSPAGCFNCCGLRVNCWASDQLKDDFSWWALSGTETFQFQFFVEDLN